MFYKVKLFGTAPESGDILLEIHEMKYSFALTYKLKKSVNRDFKKWITIL